MSVVSHFVGRTDICAALLVLLLGGVAGCGDDDSDAVGDSGMTPSADAAVDGGPTTNGGGVDGGGVSGEPEACDDGLDNDQDGEVDEGCACEPDETQQCYAGPVAQAGVGLCNRGLQRCVVTNDSNQSAEPRWARCLGSGQPEADIKDDLDNDCDSLVDEDCEAGDTVSCFGDSGSAMPGVGICRAGIRTCIADADGNTQFSQCAGRVGPRLDFCGDGLDDDCNGQDPTCDDLCAPGACSCSGSGCAAPTSCTPTNCSISADGITDLRCAPNANCTFSVDGINDVQCDANSTCQTNIVNGIVDVYCLAGAQCTIAVGTDNPIVGGVCVDGCQVTLGPLTAGYSCSRFECRGACQITGCRARCEDGSSAMEVSPNVFRCE